MPKIRRYFLKERDKKLLLGDFARVFQMDSERFFESKPGIEAIETSKHKIYLINNTPLLAKSEEDLFPTLMFNEIFPFLPKIVVDMGAVPYVCNGADVMAPGIVSINGVFKKGDLVVVVDMKHGKPIAIGSALSDSESLKAIKQGKVFKNLHHVGDEVWNTIKNLA
jgi:PUA domain protein